MSNDLEFISEPIQPDPASFDTAAMAKGQAGLPAGFTWRDQHYKIVEVLEEWKDSEREYHRRGEAYYRKHFWRIRVDDGDEMTIYALRRVKRGESPKKRWWLLNRRGISQGSAS